MVYCYFVRVTAKALHIVSFDNPFPPNYGGAIDVFYKIKALSELGVLIYLHCFIDQRTDLSGVEPFCKKIYTYPKRRFFNPFNLARPIAIQLRQNKNLEKNLKSTTAPILFDGVQTTGVLAKTTFTNQKILIRAHNIEQDYYRGLSQSAMRPLQKWIYSQEAKKFKRYERVLQKANCILAISKADHFYFNALSQVTARYIPAFQGNTKVAQLSAYGDFALYHGDLSIADNIKVVQFLIEVFKAVNYPLVIATGRNFNTINAWVKEIDHITVKYLSTQEELESLFAKAHINICYSFQQSGTKLKVINALFKGRHCIANKNVIDEELVLNQCYKVSGREELLQAISQLNTAPYKNPIERAEALQKVFDVKKNAQKIIDFL